MRVPSPSKLALAFACAHPFTSGLRWPDDESDSGTLGKAIHRAAERLARGEPVDLPGIVAEFKLDDDGAKQLKRGADSIARFLDEEAYEFERVEAEIVFALDVETGATRRLPSFDAPKKRTECRSVIDFVGIRHDGSIVVRDWKSGRQTWTHAARRNPQLAAYALAASRIYGATSMRVELAYVEADVTIDGADLSASTLAAFEQRVRGWYVENSNGPTPPVPGRHCTEQYCPLRGHCAATRAALASAYPIGADVMVPEIRDDDHARRVLSMLPQAEAALETIKRSLQAYAKRSPFETRPGVLYGLHDVETETVNIKAEGVEAILRAKLGDAADAAIKVERSSSKDAIIDAARLLAKKRGDIKRITEDVYSALREAGGMRTSKYTKVGEFTPKKEEEIGS